METTFNNSMILVCSSICTVISHCYGDDNLTLHLESWSFDVECFSYYTFLIIVIYYLNYVIVYRRGISMSTVYLLIEGLIIQTSLFFFLVLISLLLPVKTLFVYIIFLHHVVLFKLVTLLCDMILIFHYI